MKILFDLAYFMEIAIAFLIAVTIFEKVSGKCKSAGKFLVVCIIVVGASCVAADVFRDEIVFCCIVFFGSLIISLFYEIALFRKLLFSILVIALLYIAEWIFRWFLVWMAGQKEENVFSYMFIHLISLLCTFVLLKYLFWKETNNVRQSLKLLYI